MRMRGLTSWLSLSVILLIGLSAADYIVFLYHQRQGSPLSFVTVREFVAAPLKNGRYEYDYLGDMDVPCVSALLPHQRMSPCWWVSVHRDHWNQ
ncbi:hypothetical protein [Acidipila sp. EB88]|uniref:hypothetical protein n=1 Tax=Acidipila sp. EB88 TaxID=2305226 RepID=UPI000F5D683C|nr:hypothetical protein [Acidipila sp. EB88]RRA48942.1 hypothetical protein D1Y84_12315 [Acidipila sp. EB88]